MTGGGSWTAENCGTLTFQKNEAISVGESIKQEEIKNPVTKPWLLGSSPFLLYRENL